MSTSGGAKIIELWVALSEKKSLRRRSTENCSWQLSVLLTWNLEMIFFRHSYLPAIGVNFIASSIIIGIGKILIVAIVWTLFQILREAPVQRTHYSKHRRKTQVKSYFLLFTRKSLDEFSDKIQLNEVSCVSNKLFIGCSRKKKSYCEFCVWIFLRFCVIFVLRILNFRFPFLEYTPLHVSRYIWFR